MNSPLLIVSMEILKKKRENQSYFYGFLKEALIRALKDNKIITKKLSGNLRFTERLSVELSLTHSMLHFCYSRLNVVHVSDKEYELHVD